MTSPWQSPNAPKRMVINKTAFSTALISTITASLLLSDNRMLIIEYGGHAHAATHDVAG